MNEADICRKFVVPKLVAAGWDNEPCAINEQATFTDGRIVPTGGKAQRQPRKRVDYLLRYRPDMPLAVVEAKASYKTVGAGLQQAKDYAILLGLRFAYATNGKEILEFDFTTGLERPIDAFPTPSDLWARYEGASGLSSAATDRLLTPSFVLGGKKERYYQQIAIREALQAILTGQRRVLLTMATGTGKTVVAFHICWKLWESRWNRAGEPRRPRILYLSDRNILVDDPKDKTFLPFGDARKKIENGEATKGREMYFSTYQSIAQDENRPGLYKEYARDFFDLIIVDECHRGSARDESSWREILEYFQPAFQLGMTATPLCEENRDTYRYFGHPVYTYSLRQGIEDGFLAPYRVHRVVTTWDAAGWRPSQGDLDRYGREIPDGEYQTKDFERAVALKARTEAVARHLTEFMKKTDRFAKTIVFCVDQEHADEMRRALGNLNADLVKDDPDYVCRVTADEGAIGIGHLSRFQDVETKTPAILTTSQLLTTGVDAPMCKNIVLVRIIGSMTEFKQIIGRGTRVFEDGGKLFFNILDYTGTATTHFADPDFDGQPVQVIEESLYPANTKSKPADRVCKPEPTYDPGPPAEPSERRKFYFDGGQVEVAAHLVYELDPDGKQLRVVSYTDYSAERVRSIARSASDLQTAWADPVRRAEVLESLAARGIDAAEIATQLQMPDADPLDLLCHVAFQTPVRTRRQRADRLRERRDFFERFGLVAREILNELLDKYAEHGPEELVLPDALKVPPVSRHGNVSEIIQEFGGPEPLRAAVAEMQSLLYAA